MPATIILSIFLFLVGGGLFLASIKQGKKLQQMKITETYDVNEIIQEAKDVAEGLGEKGSFNKIAEVKGKILCDTPIKSELAQIDCVHYSMKVTRNWEEKYWETDAEGNKTQRIRTGSDVVASNDRSVPFYIEDNTGKIKIDPAGSEMYKEKVYSRFLQGEPNGPSITIGSFSFNFGNVSPGSGRRTIGYTYEEHAIPLNRNMYVLGEAVDNGGDLRITKPKDKENKFIVSLKSEEELSTKFEGTLKGLQWGAMACEITGAAILIFTLTGVIAPQ